MTRPTILLPLWGCLVILLAPAMAAATNDGDVGTIIENFIVGQFPDAASHFWVVNETQWDGDEMVVDVNAVIKPKQQPQPVLSRFLLLIVAGKLKGAQNVPLDGQTECNAEET